MLQRLIVAILWLCAFTVSLTPGIVALDSGGVFPWSFWALAAAVILPCLAGFLAYRQDVFPTGILPHLLTIVLLFLGVFSLMQTVSLPHSLLGILSPGSVAAWSDWHQAAGAIDAEAASSSKAAVSVSPDLTFSSAAKFFLMAALAWCGTMLFSSRSSVLLLLLLPSTLGAMHALVGLYQVFLFPDYTFWGVEVDHPFGVFVNRNNAAMLLNLSLACSLGLIGWRLAVVTGFEFGQRGFSLTTLLDLMSDKISLLALVCGGLNFMGILFCGSRGGLAGSVLGLVFSIGIFGYKPIYSKLLTGAFVTFIVALLLLAKVDVTPRTLERFGASAEGLSESITSNQRIEHWQDTLVAIKSHALVGSGFGAYRYSLLPFQKAGPSWFLHADNLWLEWSLEGGIPIIFLLLFLSVVLIAALLRLRETPDPIDHGIVTTGWYALAAIVVSQCFDFGLLLAGSAALASLIFGAVLGRAALDGMSLRFRSNPSAGPIQFKTASFDLTGLFTGILVLAALSYSTYHLQREAIVDATLRNITKPTRLSVGNENNLSDNLQRLSSLPLITSEVLSSEAALRSQSLADTIQSEAVRLGLTDDRVKLKGFAAFRWLRILRRELESTTTQSAEVNEFVVLLDQLIGSLQPQIAELRRILAETLNQSPLDPDPRFLYLLTTLSSQENKLIEYQLLGLRGHATESLETLGTYASDSGDWPLVTNCWQRLIENSPHRVEEFLVKAQQVGHPNPVSVIPNNNSAIARAADMRLKGGYVDSEFLEQALDVLRSPLPESRGKRAERYLLLARIAQALKDFPVSEEYYRDAIDASPTLLEIRLSYIASMLEQGQLANARRYADSMKELFGEGNYQLNQILHEIGEKRRESGVE